MMNLIKSELFKIRKERNLFFIILGIISVLSLSIFGFSSKVTVIGIRNILNTNSINLASGSNILIEILKSGDILILMFLPIIISVFMMDFTTGTVKNNIISGYSRSKIYISKLIVCSIICIALVLIYSTVAFVLITLKNGYDGKLTFNLIVDTIKIIALQCPLYIAAISTAFMIGAITKRKSAVITIYLLYQVVVLMISAILGRIFPSIIKYEPISNLDKVAHIGTNTCSDNLMFIIIGLIIILVTTIIGILRINKIDIK